MQQPEKFPKDIKSIPIDEKDNLLDASRQALEIIRDIGYDYDGESSVEGLKGLVDELVGYATDGLNGKRPQYISQGKINELVMDEWKEVPEERIDEELKGHPWRK